jgi:hypothetical protein
MTKRFTANTDTLAQFRANVNTLVNVIGDVQLLNPSFSDSDLVSSINNLANIGSGVDSAAILAMLDSAGFIPFTTTDSNGGVVFTTSTQTITGQKTFAQNVKVTKTDPSIDLNLNSYTYALEFDSDGFAIRSKNISGDNKKDIVKINSQDSNFVESIDFYTGNKRLTASIEPDTYAGDQYTLVNLNRGDNRYIRNASATVNTSNIVSASVITSKIANDAVTSAKLANVVSLVIYDSNGVPLKTLYGAGS